MQDAKMGLKLATAGLPETIKFTKLNWFKTGFSQRENKYFQHYAIPLRDLEP
jgi:hypothetical protein